MHLYTPSHLFYEVRLLLVLAGITMLFVQMKMPDQIVKYFILKYLKRKLSLPVTIDELRYIKTSILLYDYHVKMYSFSVSKRLLWMSEGFEFCFPRAKE